MALDYVVYKTAAMPVGVQKIEFHAGFEFLHTDYQHGKIAFWYRCLRDAPVIKRKVAFVATGETCPDPADSIYLGTYLLHSGSFVLHAFMRKL